MDNENLLFFYYEHNSHTITTPPLGNLLVGTYSILLKKMVKQAYRNNINIYT